MAPSPCIELCDAQRRRLLGLARASVQHGLAAAAPLPVAHLEWEGPLAHPGGAFVTLQQRGRLRGCIGALESTAPLAVTVVDSAYGAAFRDPRFRPLQPEEVAAVSIEITVLSVMEPFAVASREELLTTLRPGRDGLLLAEGHRRATFLPKVWDQLPEPGEFLAQLLRKAGLPADHWSPRLRFHRYEGLCFGEGADAA